MKPALRGAALAAATCAVLTLPDPERLNPGGRHLLRLGGAAFAGWVGWRASQDDAMPFVSPGAFGAATTAAAALALAPVEEAADRWLSGRLRRAGLDDPRPVMAVAAAGLGALVWAVDARERTGVEDLVDVDDEDDERPLALTLRQILGAMISAGPDQVAGERLLAQLEEARMIAFSDEFESTVQLVVAEEAPRVVPHTQVWPVRARWHIGEHPVELSLQLHEGRLDHVSLVPSEEEYPPGVDPFEDTPVDDPDNTWPDLAQVNLVLETAEGLLRL